MDLTGKNIIFVAGLGGIGFDACKQFLTRNVAVSINIFWFLQYLVVLYVMENPKAVQTLQALQIQKLK